MTPINRRQAFPLLGLFGACPFLFNGCSGSKNNDLDWGADPQGFPPILEESGFKDLKVNLELIQGINHLGWDLLPNLEQTNPFFSPASLGISLGMLERGAEGKTREELRKVLSLPPQNGMKGPAWKTFIQFLRVRKPKRQVRLANCVFLQSGDSFAPDFQADMKEWFLTEQESVDYKSAPDEASKAINQWISKRLKQANENGSTSDGLNSLTRLVLVNVIHFQGEWDQRFETSKTKDAPFETEPGKSKPFPFMNLSQGEFEGVITKDLRIIRLKFKEKDRDLQVIIPNQRHGLKDLFHRLKPGDWNPLLFDRGYPTKVDVSLPKFLMKSELLLRKPLEKCGLTMVFDGNTANLSRMNGSKEPLFVQSIVQQTQFLMNEDGARAATVTKIPAGVKSEGPRPGDPFIADQPFLVAITDRVTNTILFLGRIDDPQPVSGNA